MLADIDEQGHRASSRLLAAAAGEFSRHGFANARIRNIVDAARVNQAAANYYFGGKQGLYRAPLTLAPQNPVAFVRNVRICTPLVSAAWF